MGGSRLCWRRGSSVALAARAGSSVQLGRPSRPRWPPQSHWTVAVAGAEAAEGLGPQSRLGAVEPLNPEHLLHPTAVGGW